MNRLVVGNLKMNILTPAERERYIESFNREMDSSVVGNVDIVLCPPALHLEQFVDKLKSERTSIGAQNIFWEERGSYTGEISSAMIRNFGVNYVIIGHSERRKYFAETDDTANAKINSALKNGAVPIYCVGETKEDRENGNAAEVIARQMDLGLAGVPISKISSVVVAYEPVWAVGSDVIPTSDDILEVKILLKKILADAYGLPVVERVRILYGGSVKAATVERVCIEPGMDGVLVGRESLIPREFIKIAEIINRN